MSFSAVLIAGGKSTRFGEDKAFVFWQGEPLWKHQVSKLRQLNPAEILISCREDQKFEGSETFFRVHDEVKDRGPLAGLSASLNHASEPLTLVLAVDLPNMAPSFLGSLLDQATPERGVVTRWENGFWEPLAAVYPTAEVAKIANRRLNEADLSLQGLIKEASNNGLIREVPLSEKDREMFVNVNTRDDLSEAGQ